jgi:3-hydroxyacyl-CoA dehydrogenase/enoyl-CoA hydratase/3-hydroxybutyryl-CoA epimerase
MTFKNFHFELDDNGVATVLIDRHDESMNTLGKELVLELSAVVDRLEEPDVKAVVIGSSKRDFLAGADIRMFSQISSADDAIKALQALHGPFDRLEALHTVAGKPLVAAVDGACLGGGLELALTASMRICTDSPRTQFGQPEVQLGLIPAAGGTQRLPELIGLAAGLQMIVGGKPVRPYKARKLGLVDEIVPAAVLLDVARTRAAEAIGAKPPERVIALNVSTDNLMKYALEKNPAGRKVLFKKATEVMLKETGGHYPAPPRAIEAIQIGADHGRAAGVAAEMRFFAELVFTPESGALQSVFFASTQLKGDSGVDSDATPRTVDHIAVVGGGLMGGGIAAVSAIKTDATVRIKEVDTAAVGRGLQYVSKVVSKNTERRRWTPFEVDKIMNRVTGSSTWAGFSNTDIVIEAVFENLDLKRSILAQCEETMGPETIFASNTSSLPISEIAEDAERPENVVGMHYFSPVEKMPLLEVIATDKTSDETTATAVAVGKAQGKTVIVVNDGTGFYTTRVLGPYSNEAAYLLAEGASVEDIDSAMTAWGFPIGPLLLADEVGIDVGSHIAVILHDAFGDRMAGPPMMEGLIADDRKGRKNGRGFYVYDKGERKGVDETVYDALGLGPRKDIDRSEIQERISLAFINEAAHCLGDGILRSASDGDVGAIFGLGYPPFRGGPFWTIDQMGAETVVDKLIVLAAKHGDRFEPAQILRDYAADDKKFR